MIARFVNKTLHNSTDELLSDFYDLLPPELSTGGESILSHLGVDALIGEICATFEGTGSRVISFLSMLIGLAVLLSLAALPSGRLGAICEGGVGVIASFAILLSLYPLVSEAVAATYEVSEFFSLLVPLLLSYLSLGGGITTVSTASLGLQFTIWLMGLLTQLLGGIAVAMLAISAMSSLGESGVTRIAKGIKNAFGKVMGALTAVLAGTLALQTYISASADSATIRMAKHAAGDMIPVVGGAVSGALSTLSGGLSYAGSIIGGGAVAAILAISLSPMVLLLLYKLCLTLAMSFIEFTGKGGGVSCFSGFAAALDAVISVYTMTTIIYILEVVVLVMGGEMIFG